MRTQFSMLFQHEFDALLDALRRDVRAEQQRRLTDAEFADCHVFNASMSRKLLEILAPRVNLAERRLWTLRHGVARAAHGVVAEKPQDFPSGIEIASCNPMC
jgi:hypothetical protein